VWRNELVWRSPEEIHQGRGAIWQAMKDCVFRGCHTRGCFCEGDERGIERFLLTAGEIGSIIKNEATISAAMGGCQAEIGSRSIPSSARCGRRPRT
jgi:L-serine deaminase